MRTTAPPRSPFPATRHPVVPGGRARRRHRPPRAVPIVGAAMAAFAAAMLPVTSVDAHRERAPDAARDPAVILQ